MKMAQLITLVAFVGIVAFGPVTGCERERERDIDSIEQAPGGPADTAHAEAHGLNEGSPDTHREGVPNPDRPVAKAPDRPVAKAKDEAGNKKDLDDWQEQGLKEIDEQL